jgi:hypothetical protein
MSEPRPVLLVAAADDEFSVGAVALETAATLASAGVLAPVVCALPGPLLKRARDLGLLTLDLSDSSRIDRRRQLVDCAGAAHLVHALGFDAARLLGSARVTLALPLVVTIDHSRPRRSALRRGSHIRVGTPIRWLVHGSTATGRFVQCGAARGDEVVTLPLLEFAPDAGTDWRAARESARRTMALEPGVRAVVGFGPASGAGFRHLDATLASPGRHAFAGLWIDTDRSGTAPRRQGSRVVIVRPAEGQHLLACADVLVADGTTIAARHAAVDALKFGVPVVTTPTDLAAGLVSHSVNGYICAPRELHAAVAAAVTMSVARTLRRSSFERRRGDLPADPVEATARCYASILDRPLVRPILIGRTAAG